MHCNFGDKHKTIAPADMKNLRNGNVKGSFCTVTRDKKIYNCVQRYIKKCQHLCWRKDLQFWQKDLQTFGSGVPGRGTGPSPCWKQSQLGWETVCREIYPRWFYFQHIQLTLLYYTILSNWNIFRPDLWTTGTNFASSPAHFFAACFCLQFGPSEHS